MAFPIKVCAICSEEFELKPDKPGFANRCPECSAPEADDPGSKRGMDTGGLKNEQGSERGQETSDSRPSLPQGQLTAFRRAPETIAVAAGIQGRRFATR